MVACQAKRWESSGVLGSRIGSVDLSRNLLLLHHQKPGVHEIDPLVHIQKAIQDCHL